MKDIEQDYIKYVKEIIDKYSKASKLIEGDEVTPQALNSALANYIETNLCLISEYQRAKISLYKITRDYDRWYDQEFIRIRKKMIEEIDTKTIKIAVKEVETQLRVECSDKYYEFQDKINEAEYQVSLLLRLLEQYKKFDSVLVNLSQNMRSELRSLSVENRINLDPNKNRVRSRMPIGR